MEKATKKDIRKIKEVDLEAFLQAHNQPKFRAKQIWEWVWEKSASSFDDMTNLPLSLRDTLSQSFVFNVIKVDSIQRSIDGTMKFGMRLYDDNLIESVLIPTENRMTACVSSQVGCSLTCSFCATGYLDRVRNLDPAEIYDQVVEVNRQALATYQMPLSNIVFMGMGEPLLNYQSVLSAIGKITSENGLHISSKRITVSTAGVAKMIRKLADDNVKFNLALSLHAANDEKRSRIMPINETNTLEALSDALLYFHNQTGNRITFEYIVFENFNDTLQDALELYQFAKKIPAKINIIEYNPISNIAFKNTSEDRLLTFVNYLESKRFSVTIRRSRGKDIDAACGQLAGKNNNTNK